MVHAPDVRAAPHHIEEPQEICRPGGMSFVWSFSKIRIASLVLLGTATPAIACFLVSGSFVRWLCVRWLAGVALFMRGLGRRAVADTVVLSVDQRGILDHRLMPKHITWQEIEAVCPVDTDCSCVVDIELRWPKVTLGEARWPVRIGAYCQMAYGVPAVTISMLLLERQCLRSAQCRCSVSTGSFALQKPNSAAPYSTRSRFAQTERDFIVKRARRTLV